MRFAALLLLTGIALLSYAYVLPPYTDVALFNERYLALPPGDTPEYELLWAHMQTPKFSYQDYSGTLITAAIAIFLVVRHGGWRNVQSPRSWAALFGIAFVLPFLSTTAYVFNVALGYERGEYPYWADSMGIPVMTAVPLFCILFIWAGLHLLFIERRTYQPAPLRQVFSCKANWWLLLVATLTLLLIVKSVAHGQYWYAVPGALWLYFYLSLAAVHRSTSDSGSSTESLRHTHDFGPQESP